MARMWAQPAAEARTQTSDRVVIIRAPHGTVFESDGAQRVVGELAHILVRAVSTRGSSPWTGFAGTALESWLGRLAPADARTHPTGSDHPTLVDAGKPLDPRSRGPRIAAVRVRQHAGQQGGLAWREVARRFAEGPPRR